MVALACHRRLDDSASFAQSLRCGMTRADVARAAREHGYDSSDAQWLSRSASAKAPAKRLTFVDLTFRDGHLVAIREDRYDPHTKRTQSRTVDLCSGAGSR